MLPQHSLTKLMCCRPLTTHPFITTNNQTLHKAIRSQSRNAHQRQHDIVGRQSQSRMTTQVKIEVVVPYESNDSTLALPHFDNFHGHRVELWALTLTIQSQTSELRVHRHTRGTPISRETPTPYSTVILFISGGGGRGSPPKPPLAVLLAIE